MPARKRVNKSKATTTPEPVKVEEPKVEQVQEPEPEVTPDTPVDDKKVSYAELTDSLIETAQNITAEGRTLVKGLRALRVQRDRDVKEEKQAKRAARKTSSKSGFGTNKISDALAAYLDIDADGEYNRQHVMNLFHAKIRNPGETRDERQANGLKGKGLQDPSDMRIIMFEKDAGLKKLLNLPAAFKEQGHTDKETGKFVNDTQLTYFNLQRYLAPHFLPKEA